MRWLGILAIVIAGAAIYLRSMMSGATAPQRPAAAPQAEGPPVQPEPEKPKPEPTRVAPKAPLAIKPAAPPPSQPAQAAPPPRPIDPVVAAPADAAAKSEDEETPWTEQERWQKLWAANGRLEKGNYPGAVELSLEIARRHPPWQEDAWKVTIKAYCAMSEADKANALFQKMTDAGAIEEILKFCTEWNVKLHKSK